MVEHRRHCSEEDVRKVIMTVLDKEEQVRGGGGSEAFYGVCRGGGADSAEDIFMYMEWGGGDCFRG